MEAFIDWLQFTVFEDFENDIERTYSDVIDQYLNLNVSDFQSCGGLYGYKGCQQFENIRVLYDGPDLMGIHVQISGKGCRYLETLNNFDWNKFLGHLVYLNVSFTRVDVAFDQKKYFDCDKIQRYVESDRICSRFRKYGITSTNKIGTSEVCGKTIYFGSRASKTFIRFYDKGLESGGEIEGTRLEIVLRDDKASQFVFQYLKKENFYNLTYLTSKVVNYYLRFIKNNSTRKERCGIAKWWSEFLNTAEKLSLGKGNGVVTLERICSWFEKQVSTSLKLIIETKGLAYVENMVNNAKLNNKQSEIKRMYKIEGVS